MRQVVYFDAAVRKCAFYRTNCWVVSYAYIAVEAQFATPKTCGILSNRKKKCPIFIGCLYKDVWHHWWYHKLREGGGI